MSRGCAADAANASRPPLRPEPRTPAALFALPIGPELFSPRADYLLQVRGNSMCGVGILDGDLMAVHHTAEARSGQIVVTRLEDEVTVKRLQRRGSRVELMAENPDYAPIVVNGPMVIEGLGIGLMRGGRAL